MDTEVFNKRNLFAISEQYAADGIKGTVTLFTNTLAQMQCCLFPTKLQFKGLLQICSTLFKQHLFLKLLEFTITNKC